MPVPTTRLSTLAASLLIASLAPAAALAQVTLYEHDNYQGRTFTTAHAVGSLRDSGFNDRASSLVVTGQLWEVCDNADFGGRCVVLRPGNYPSLGELGLNDRISSVRMASEPQRGADTRPLAPAADAADALVFYENANFSGRTFGTAQEVPNFTRFGFNDRASSIIVNSGRWEVCDNANFGGRCAALQPGRYASLSAMGLNDRISSVRRVGADGGPRATPSPWQRRGDELLFVVPVTAVRAVLATPEQRCWIEQQPQPQSGGDKHNVPGALVGAIIGGVLGHQVGGGTGRDIATVGGAVAGAVVGSRVGSDGRREATQDVKRCQTEPSARTTDYWDVSYTFRGQQHNVQMSTPPGPTITVNHDGEPRE